MTEEVIKSVIGTHKSGLKVRINVIREQISYSTVGGIKGTVDGRLRLETAAGQPVKLAEHSNYAVVVMTAMYDELFHLEEPLCLET